MQRQFKTEGIILKRRQLLNKDLLITLNTFEYGKINVMAKGVRDIKSKRLSAILTGNLVDVILYNRFDRYYLQSTHIISLFSSIIKDEKKQKSLFFFLYVLDQLLPEGQKEEKVYNLQKKFMIEIANNGLSNASLIKFANRILALLGYRAESTSMYELLSTLEEITVKKIPSFII